MARLRVKTVTVTWRRPTHLGRGFSSTYFSLPILYFRLENLGLRFPTPGISLLLPNSCLVRLGRNFSLTCTGLEALGLLQRLSCFLLEATHFAIARTCFLHAPGFGLPRQGFGLPHLGSGLPHLGFGLPHLDLRLAFL